MVYKPTFTSLGGNPVPGATPLEELQEGDVFEGTVTWAESHIVNCLIVGTSWDKLVKKYVIRKLGYPKIKLNSTDTQDTGTARRCCFGS